MALQVYSIRELLDLPAATYLIDGIITRYGLVSVYGEPGGGKSFVALDMALSVAFGVPWHGHATRKGYVIYISAEGGSGISPRVGAWLDDRGIIPNHYQFAFSSFVVSAVSIRPDSEELKEVINCTIQHDDYQSELASAGIEEEDEPPVFIIVDTLARCFEGDENKQEDMGQFIKALDWLRDEYGATVLVVHHTGATGTRERGSSSFRGACDTMIRCSKKTGTMDITLTCTKQKDSAEFDKMKLILTPVEKWGSCIVTAKPSGVATPDQTQRAAVAAYQDAHPGSTIRAISEAMGIPKSTVYRHQVALREEAEEG